MPILAAPTAFHRLAHCDGELATARGVGAAKTLMVLSSLSTCLLEDVAAVASGPLWFQVCINKDRGFTTDLVQRAVAAGYRAIVVTCDAPCRGVRHCPDALHSTRSRRICLGETHDQEDGSAARFAAVFWSAAVKKSHLTQRQVTDRARRAESRRRPV